MYHQNTSMSTGSSAGTMDLSQNRYTHQEESEIPDSPKKHSQKINKNIEELEKAVLISRRGQRDPIRTGGRKNKNEILALALIRLIKRKYLNGTKYIHDMELIRELQTNVNHGEFTLVLRTDGRIIIMSDEAEHHLGKTMRSLYTQCLNIFECLDETDGNKLRLILSSSVDSTRQEHRLVCSLRLPKGKRPSRVHEDVKTITMAGHFYSCHGSSSSATNERLFIARCEALISTTANRSNSSQTATSVSSSITTNSQIKLVLNEDMTIQTVLANTQNILGYTNKDLCGSWLGRYLETSDVMKFEDIRQRYFTHESEQQQQPISVCEIFDIYTNNGDGRLTFLCQIRPIRERRKPIKFSVIGQLIDPSLRNEYKKYVRIQSEVHAMPFKAEQVNLVSASISKTSEDTVVADSPSFANMAQLIHDGIDHDYSIHSQQYSPFIGTLSNGVAPLSVNEQSWNNTFNFDYSQYSSTTTTTATTTAAAAADYQYWPSKPIDIEFFNDESAEELESFIKQSMYGW